MRTLWLMAGCLVVLSTPLGGQDRVTSRQRQEVRRVQSLIDRAGNQFRAKNYEESAQTIADAQTRLMEIAQDAGVQLMELIKPQYERLKTAHQMLSEQGQELAELQPLPIPKGAEGTVTFSQQVAPVLLAKCGRCHVNRSSGDFSMASFAALMQGQRGVPVIAAGRPKASRLIEVIESGDMPRGGLTVTEEELDTLKNWIAAGALYDRQNAEQNLAELAQPAAAQQPPPVEVVMARGDESVSFGLDVAPVLVASCTGCHFEAQNVRGGLNFTNFDGLLRGGDSGRAIVPGNGDGSLLVQKLRGTAPGQQMPLGKPALAEEAIDRIRTWIDEGARFDGRQSSMNLRQVAALARAVSATHEQLSQQRKTLALENWQLVMSTAPQATAETESTLVVAAVPQELTDQFAEAVQQIADRLRSMLKIEADQPLVKGRITVYVFDRRYDYNEFGKMVEGRDLPKSWHGHWGFDTISAYVAFLYGDEVEDYFESSQGLIAQRVAGTYVASLQPDIPRWFADGVGFAMAARLFPRDELVKSWKDLAAESVGTMGRADDFVQNRMPEDQAGLVGYLFVQAMMEGPRFNRLMNQLHDGHPFGEAFAEIYGGPPDELARRWVGQR